MISSPSLFFYQFLFLSNLKFIYYILHLHFFILCKVQLNNCIDWILWCYINKKYYYYVLLQKHKVYINQLMDKMEVHVTVANITTLPAGIINHGILSSEGYRKLLSRAKVLIATMLSSSPSPILRCYSRC